MSDIQRQSWDQYLIKSQMGLLNGLNTINYKFHWKFWKPIKVIGGEVYFGRYVELSQSEIQRVSDETEARNKK